jgi:acyl-coenzyme A synthetase/AMP-(fatty) acid ligase
VLHSGRFNWTYVLGTGLMDPLFQGHTVIAHEGSGCPDTWPRLIKQHKATIFVAVPAVYRRILERTNASRADVPTLRHCMSAGEGVAPALLGSWRDRFGLEIYEALGMSEISYYVSNSVHAPVVPGSVGKPQPGHRVEVLEPETLQPAAPGHRGVIAVRSDDPGLFLRYWGSCEPDTAKRAPWFVTGDWGHFDSAGYLWLSGRSDEQINSFGHRVSPLEVERVLANHPDVADCACVGQRAGESSLVVAYCILRGGPHSSGTSVAEHILNFGVERLARYKAPRIIYLVEDLPRTRNGKIQRHRLNSERAYGSFSLKREQQGAARLAP